MAKAKKPSASVSAKLRRKKPPARKKKPQMTAQQKAAWDKLSPLDQLMAPHILAGKFYADAYRLAKGAEADGMNQNTLRVVARNIANKPAMKAYLDAMNCEIVNQWIMGREEALERLTTIGRANLGDLLDFRDLHLGEDEDGSPLVQATWKLKDQAAIDPNLIGAVSELTAGRDGFKIKLHPALSAIKQLSEMQGWEAPKKLDHSSSDGTMAPLKEISEDQLKEKLKELGIGRKSGQLDERSI